MLMTDDASTKVLGVCWKVASDALSFRISNLQDIVFTRTGLASIVARIYDPLGLAAPWIVKAKSKLRETRIRGLDWPDLVPEEDQTWWRSWADTLQELNGLALPRCLFPNEEKIVHSELHTLSDASEEAFASAVYIRNVYEDGSTMPDSSCRKLRWPSISIPKLELQAALLGACLAKYVQSAITRKLHRRWFWTDVACL